MSGLRPVRSMLACLACGLSAVVALAASGTGARAAATFCAPVQVIDSRGSGQTGFSAPGATVQQGLKFDLGEIVAIEANPYPAVSILPSFNALIGLTGDLAPSARLQAIGNALNGIGALTRTSGLGIGAYRDSVLTGRTDLAGLVRSFIARCPATPLVLTGYSQGAEVTGDVFTSDLTSAQRGHIAGVALFGDPRYRPGSYADQQSWPLQGILGERAEFPSDGKGLVFSFCHQHDPICQAQIASDAAHETYVTPGRDAIDAVALIAPRIEHEQSLTGTTHKYIHFDLTTSMGWHYVGSLSLPTAIVSVSVDIKSSRPGKARIALQLTSSADVQRRTFYDVNPGRPDGPKLVVNPGALEYSLPSAVYKKIVHDMLSASFASGYGSASYNIGPCDLSAPYRGYWPSGTGLFCPPRDGNGDDVYDVPQTDVPRLSAALSQAGQPTYTINLDPISSACNVDIYPSGVVKLAPAFSTSVCGGLRITLVS